MTLPHQRPSGRARDAWGAPLDPDPARPMTCSAYLETQLATPPGALGAPDVPGSAQGSTPFPIPSLI
jgi:hypothetical protein